MVEGGSPELSRLAADVLSRLSCLGMLAAAPTLPFPEHLVRRAPGADTALLPLDTETRTFLHDIPFLRKDDLGQDPAATIATLLSNRKGVIAEGIGIVASGPVTLEQAYIHYSSVFHACYVKYLLDVLQEGFLLPGEAEAFRAFRETFLRPPTAEGLSFRRRPPRHNGKGSFGDPRRRPLHRRAGAGRLLLRQHLVPCRGNDLHLPDRGVPRRTRRVHRPGPDG